MPRRSRSSDVPAPIQQVSSPPSSPFGRAWQRTSDTYDSIMPDPKQFAGGEDQGSVELGLIRIPALIFYFPVYYILFFLWIILLFPFFFLYSLLK